MSDTDGGIVQLIAERRWKRVQVADPGLVPEGQIVRMLSNVDPEKVEEVVSLLRANTSAKNSKPTRFVDDPLINNRKKAGRYRNVTTISKYEQDEKGNMVHNVYQTLAEGFLESLVFSAAKIIDHQYLPSAGATVSGVSGSASDNPQRYVMFEWAGCNPGKTEAIVASAPSTIPANTSVEGQSVEEGLRLQVTSSKRADDGSTTITALYAKAELTLTGFSDYLGSNSKAVHYLNQVPQTLAQGIMTAWKTAGGAGRTAIQRGYDQTKGFVDITLYSVDGDAPNYNLTGFQEHCDTVTNIYFAWRYTKDQLAAFFTSHPAPSSMAGVTRKVQTNERGDGFYDATIFETTVTWDVAKHKVLFDALGSAGKVVRTVEWGWNIPITNFDALKTSYSATSLGDGYTCDFRTTRNDNCTFDYEAQKVQEKYRSFLTAVEGTKNESVSILAGDAALASEVPADVTGVLVAGEERSVRIRLRENNLIDFVCLKKTKTAYALTKQVVGGSAYVKVELERQYNQTTAPTIEQPTETGVTVDADVEKAPDETMSARIRTETRTPIVSTSTISTRRKTTTITRTKRRASEVTAPTLTPNHQIRAENEGNEDKTFESALVDDVVTADVSSEIEIFNDGIVKKTLTLYYNRAAPLTLTTGQRLVNPDFNEYGAYDYAVETTTILKASLVIESQALANVSIDTIKSFLEGVSWYTSGIYSRLIISGTPKLTAYNYQTYVSFTIKVTRAYSLTPSDCSNPSAPTVSTTGARTETTYRAGYDAERGVHFIDTIIAVYNAISTFGGTNGLVKIES